jgi:signal-transduction protein with cAMP-binding, CBS, and nucleotidyltransferase domain
MHFQTQCVDVLKASLVSKVYFLSKESPKVIQNLANILTFQVYMPMDWIIKTKRVREMYFISRGRVVLVDSFRRIISNLSHGDSFGEMALFEEEGFKLKALAETFCELYQLDNDIFNSVLDAFYADPNIASRRKQEMKGEIEKRENIRRKTRKFMGKPKTLQSVFDRHHALSGRWYCPGSK